MEKLLIPGCFFQLPSDRSNAPTGSIKRRNQAPRCNETLTPNILVISAFISRIKVATVLESGSVQICNDLTAAAAAFREILSIASVRLRNTSGGDLLRKLLKLIKIKLERC